MDIMHLGRHYKVGWVDHVCIPQSHRHYAYDRHYKVGWVDPVFIPQLHGQLDKHYIFISEIFVYIIYKVFSTLKSSYMLGLALKGIRAL